MPKEGFPTTQEQDTSKNKKLKERVKFWKEKVLYGRKFNELKTRFIETAGGAIEVYAFRSRGTEVESDEVVEKRFNERKEEALKILEEYEAFVKEHPELETEGDRKDIESAKDDLSPEKWEEEWERGWKKQP